jgi:xanthine dehydrogenase YagS FAD-binding subunit
MLPDFAYVRPNSIEDAVQQLSTQGAVLHAGGTDLLGCLREDIFSATKLVSISKLEGLQGISPSSDGGLRIGALTKVTEIANDPLLKERWSAIAGGASEVGSPQLRNQGTIGGNVCQKPRCWYYRGDFHCRRKGGDMCYAFGGENQFHAIFGSDSICCIVHPSDIAPGLVAFEAQAKVTGPQGTRTVPVEKFHVLPSENVEKETVLEQGEIVSDILLPAPPAGTRSSYRKIRARRSWDFALAGVALALTFQGNKISRARVVLSGAAPTPWRLRHVEEMLTGKSLDAKLAAQAARAAMKNAEPLSRNDYKIPLFEAMLQEQFLAFQV